MKFTSARRGVALMALTAGAALVASGCSAGSLGSSDSDGADGAVTITFLVDSGENSTKSAQAVADAFHAANPDITVKLDGRPGGGDGDNIVKTKLSTGDMAEVFQYNNGSLLAALKPAQNLTPLDDESWVGDLDPQFADASKSDGKLYAAPWGTAFGGGVLYNKPLYAELGLQIPTTWSEFMANNDKVKAAGKTAVEQTFGDTWTAQMIVLAGYNDVEAANPDFADQYTAGTAKYATTPAALLGFEHIQSLYDGGYFNKDFASAKLNDGLAAVATGAAAHYPQIGAVAPGIDEAAPGKSNDVGMFALPAQDAAASALTYWPGAGLYIPKTVEGDKLEAAKKFVAFAATQEGCDAYGTGSPPTGPYLTSACTLPADVSTVAKDTQAYVDDDMVTTALEFKSPIKGPSLEQILVQVGTGQVDGAKGAALYDQDVKKQAQQLGLPGFD